MKATRWYELRNNLRGRSLHPQTAKELEGLGFNKDEIADLLKWMRKNTGWAWAGEYPDDKPIFIRGVIFTGTVPNYYMGGAIGMKIRGAQNIRWLYDFWDVVKAWHDAIEKRPVRDAKSKDAVST